MARSHLWLLFLPFRYKTCHMISVYLAALRSVRVQGQPLYDHLEGSGPPQRPNCGSWVALGLDL